jgi:hypothetical protein
MLWEHESLRVTEFHIQLSSDGLRQQCAAHQGATHHGQVMLDKLPGESNGKALNRTRSEKKQIKVEPQVAVMTRFEFEMPLAGGQQTQELLLYRFSALARDHLLQ